MPKIHEYQPQQNAPSPVSISSNANDFGAQAYQGAANLGSGLEDAGTFLEKRATQGEVSDTSAKLADFKAKKLQELTEGLKTATPGDSTFVDQFMDQYDKDVSSIQNGIQTPGAQNYFERTNERVRDSLLESAAHGQAELAGVQASSNLMTLRNKLSDATMMSPPDFEKNLQQLNEGIDAQVQSGMLKQDVAIGIKGPMATELAKSAVMGWARTNPAYAKQLLQSNKYDAYIDGDNKEQLFGKIQQAETRDRVDQALKQKLIQDKIAAEQSQTQQDFMSKMLNGQMPSAKDIDQSNLEAFGQGSKDTFYKMLQAHSEDKINYTNPQKFFDWIQKANLPDGDPNKATDERKVYADVGNGLSLKNANDIIGVIQGKRTSQGKQFEKLEDAVMETAKGDLIKDKGIFGIADNQGKALYTQWYSDFSKRLNDGIAAGKSKADLLDPRSKDFVGSTAGYKRSQQEILNDSFAGIKGNVPSSSFSPPNNNPGTPQVQKEAIPQAPKGYVNIRSPKDGKVKVIPESQAADATAAGGTLVP